MPKEHLVIVKNVDGSVTSYKMKEWLRKNPTYIPEGLHPDTSSSHELRRGLRRNGWTLEEKADKVLVIKPDNGIINEEEIEALGLGGEESSEEEILEAEEITFGLERDLQMALRANIAQLETGLVIVDGGKEKITEAGRIDITAKDDKGNLVIIELKAGRANPDVIAQILAYMGSVADAEGATVRGILVAGDFHKRVVLASKAIPNLCLKKYSFQFSFCDIA